MRLLVTALALSTLSLTSCGKEQAEVRVAPIAPDAAKLHACPKGFPIPPGLVPLAPFTLPDGRVVVLLDTVIDRETATARFIIASRGAWQACQSAVAYVEDWASQVRSGSAVKP